MSGAKSRFIVDRRSVLGGAAAATALGALPTRLAWGQGAKTLRAGITGYNVINTLDPGKASLIPEFYVIWAIYNGLVKFDAKMNIVPDLAESFKVQAAPGRQVPGRLALHHRRRQVLARAHPRREIRLAEPQQGVGDRQDRDRRSAHPAHLDEGAVRAAPHLPRQRAHRHADPAAQDRRGGARRRFRQEADRHRRLYAEGLAAGRARHPRRLRRIFRRQAEDRHGRPAAHRRGVERRHRTPRQSDRSDLDRAFRRRADAVDQPADPPAQAGRAQHAVFPAQHAKAALRRPRLPPRRLDGVRPRSAGQGRAVRRGRRHGRAHPALARICLWR